MLLQVHNNKKNIDMNVFHTLIKIVQKLFQNMVELLQHHPIQFKLILIIQLFLQF